MVHRICQAAGAPGPSGGVPYWAGWLAGAAVEAAWSLTRRRDTPPLTRFLAEQLATAHWFDQRRTRAALGWAPRVSLEDGFAALTAWYRSQPQR
jgi:2-alkyl-3-oxoalkanoate reductase